MLRAVTFDFWGTLADARHSLRDERIAFLRRYLSCDMDRIAAAYERAWHYFDQGLAQGYGLGTATVLSAVLDDLGASLNPPSYAAVLRYWEEAMLDAPPPFLPGAREALWALRRRGLLIGLISDTGLTPGRVLRRVIAAAGLLIAFDWLTFSDEIGVTKRCPQAFTSTLYALGVQPGQALHIGDTPATDLEGARAAGLHCALLLESSQRREGIPLADLVLDRLSDLPDALLLWEQSQTNNA